MSAGAELTVADRQRELLTTLERQLPELIEMLTGDMSPNLFKTTTPDEPGDSDELFLALSSEYCDKLSALKRSSRIRVAKVQSQVLNLKWQLGDIKDGARVDFEWVEKIDGVKHIDPIMVQFPTDSMKQTFLCEGPKWGVDYTFSTAGKITYCGSYLSDDEIEPDPLYATVKFKFAERS